MKLHIWINLDERKCCALKFKKKGNMLASVQVCRVGGDICFCVKNPILVFIQLSNSLDPK